MSNNAFSLVYTSLTLHVPATRAALGLPPRLPSGAAAPPAPPPPSDSEVLGKAQLRATDSLTALASSLADGGKLDEAVAMQRRALHLCEEVLGPDDEQSRAVLWQLGVLQERAGLADGAIESFGAWQRAGGDEAEAAARIGPLVAARAATPKAADSSRSD